jgi:hypothetical protein
MQVTITAQIHKRRRVTLRASAQTFLKSNLAEVERTACSSAVRELHELTPPACNSSKLELIEVGHTSSAKARAGRKAVTETSEEAPSHLQQVSVESWIVHTDVSSRLRKA